jgi:hypothetical protein
MRRATKNVIYTLGEEGYQMRSGFPQGHLYQCSLFTPIV